MQNVPVFQAPDNVMTLIHTLNTHGYEAVFVGGCVRDTLLGLVPKDYDIATSATPEEILAVLDEYRCLRIGEFFGTIAAVLPDRTVEITTYRKESGYEDFRHPSEVVFTRELTEDLARRDFTVNAIAWEPKRGWIDPFRGREDLRAKCLKTVGKAEDRIREDALRMLRGIRFATAYGLEPTGDFLAASYANRQRILRISVERIREEVEKMLLSEKPSDAFRWMERTGLLEVLFPRIAGMISFSQDTPYHNLSLYEHSLCVLDAVPADLSIRWAALLHDTGKLDTKVIDERGIAHFYGHDKIARDDATEILSRLRVPTKRIREVEHLIERHMANCNPYSKRSVKRLLQKIGESTLRKLFDLQEADCHCATNQGTANVTEGRRILAEVLSQNEPYRQNQLAIDGNDLIRIGIPEGKEIGKWLKTATEWVLEDPSLNDKEILIDRIQIEVRRK